MVLLAPPASDTHPSEDQLGFFGFTPEGALVVTIPQDSVEESKTVLLPVGYPDLRFPDNPAREGGERTQVRASLAAIRLLRTLQGEGREATREEQEILARYIGWGSFPGIHGRPSPAGRIRGRVEVAPHPGGVARRAGQHAEREPLDRAIRCFNRASIS